MSCYPNQYGKGFYLLLKEVNMSITRKMNIASFTLATSYITRTTPITHITALAIGGLII